jgi:hypothetical protein
LKTCSTCKQHKRNEEFYKHPTNKDGLNWYCKCCIKEYNSNRYSTLIGRAKILVNNARVRSRKKNLDFDISVDDIHEKIVAGVCEFTGISFDYSYGKDTFLNAYSPSIDKINSKKGYTKNNIRLVLTAVNRSLGEDGEKEMLPILKAMVEAIEKNAEQKESTSVSTQHTGEGQDNTQPGIVYGARPWEDCDGAHHHTREPEGQDLSDSAEAGCRICMGTGVQKMATLATFYSDQDNGHALCSAEEFAKRIRCLCYQS